MGLWDHEPGHTSVGNSRLVGQVNEQPGTALLGCLAFAFDASAAQHSRVAEEQFGS